MRWRMLNRLCKVDKNAIKKCFKKEEDGTNLDVSYKFEENLQTN